MDKGCAHEQEIVLWWDNCLGDGLKTAFCDKAHLNGCHPWVPAFVSCSRMVYPCKLDSKCNIQPVCQCCTPLNIHIHMCMLSRTMFGVCYIICRVWDDSSCVILCEFCDDDTS